MAAQACERKLGRSPLADRIDRSTPQGRAMATEWVRSSVLSSQADRAADSDALCELRSRGRRIPRPRTVSASGRQPDRPRRRPGGLARMRRSGPRGRATSYSSVVNRSGPRPSRAVPGSPRRYARRSARLRRWGGREGDSMSRDAPAKIVSHCSCGSPLQWETSETYEERRVACPLPEPGLRRHHNSLAGRNSAGAAIGFVPARASSCPPLPEAMGAPLFQSKPAGIHVASPSRVLSRVCRRDDDPTRATSALRAPE